MALYLASIAFQADSALPRDRITITAHFAGDAPQALADALKTNLSGHVNIGTKPFTVKIYDALKAPPSYPLGQAVNGSGSFTTNTPREIALCLSYYAAFNRPRTRGRMFLPFFIIGGALDLRPTTTQMTNALNFRNMFTTGLPTGHKWNTYSPTSGGSEPVTDVWVDDEWDTMRSRGLKGTTRQTATVAP